MIFKTVRKILRILFIVILILGSYYIGRLHGSLTTIGAMGYYREVCIDMEGIYIENETKCIINNGDYCYNIKGVDNLVSCQEEKASMYDKLSSFILFGRSMKKVEK